MTRVVLALLLAAAVGASLWIWSDNRRLAIGLDDARREAAEARGAVASLQADVRRLEHELARSLASRQSVLETIERHRAELEEMRAVEAARLVRATKAPPEGVRLALLTLNELLAADGFGGLRFLYAARIAERAMHDVELLEHRVDRFSTAIWTANRIELELDRATGILVLRAFGGEVIAGDESREFPEEGEAIALDAVDGAVWESRLPFLVRAHGRYPAEVAAERDRAVIDPATASAWTERLDRLLDAAGTDLRLRVGRVRDLRESRFRGVLLHGYDEGRVLTTSMSAASLEVSVDRDAGTVELVLRDGVLMQQGGETPIPSTGYRILLPGLEVGEARDLMLGMVVEGGGRGG